MRKTLRFDDSLAGQDTYYNCGPATCQNIVWAASAKVVAESVFARALGTTTNGTNHIGLLTGVLNQYLPDAKYVTVQLPNDPPLVGQKAVLWDNIRKSIDAGYGVAVNIVAPPGNYPKGVLGSQSPSYGGGTVFHYIMVAGYDDVARAVFIVDSGFWPRQYWITLDQLATLIVPKGYSFSTAPVTSGGATVTDLFDQDVNAQLTGDPRLGVYSGWPQLGNRTVVDALAAIGAKLGAL